MAPSSSGSGHLVLIQKIAGSNPAGVTKVKTSAFAEVFTLVLSSRVRTRRVRVAKKGTRKLVFDPF